jgi:hypothetical protein
MASIITERVARERAEIMASGDADPVLSFAYCAADLGVSLSTYRRSVLPEVPVVEISAQRRGVRRSDHEACKARRTRRRAA